METPWRLNCRLRVFRFFAITICTVMLKRLFWYCRFFFFFGGLLWLRLWGWVNSCSNWLGHRRLRLCILWLTLMVWGLFNWWDDTTLMVWGLFNWLVDAFIILNSCWLHWFYTTGLGSGLFLVVIFIDHLHFLGLCPLDVDKFYWFLFI